MARGGGQPVEMPKEGTKADSDTKAMSRTRATFSRLVHKMAATTTTGRGCSRLWALCKHSYWAPQGRNVVSPHGTDALQ